MHWSTKQDTRSTRDHFLIRVVFMSRSVIQILNKMIMAFMAQKPSKE